MAKVALPVNAIQSISKEERRVRPSSEQTTHVAQARKKYDRNPMTDGTGISPRMRQYIGCMKRPSEICQSVFSVCEIRSESSEKFGARNRNPCARKKKTAV